MRDILFRGKRRDNGEWVYGNYIHTPNVTFIYDVYETDSSHDWYEVDPATVGQFTGLTDCYGKKIFEGDIHGMPGWIVTYCADVNEGEGMNAGWYVQRDNWESWMPLENHSEHKIIGNIHDNPELLEEEE